MKIDPLQNDPLHKAVLMARSIERRALDADPISMSYVEVKAVLNALELQEIAHGIEASILRRNEAEMMVLELLHVLASSDPHGELVRESLISDTNVFERACGMLGVEMAVAGSVGANNG